MPWRISIGRPTSAHRRSAADPSPRPPGSRSPAGTPARASRRPARRSKPRRRSCRRRPVMRRAPRPPRPRPARPGRSRGPSSGRARIHVRPASCQVGTSPAGGRSTVGSGALAVQQPRRPDERVSRQRQLDGGREDPQARLGAVVHEDRLAVAELRRDPLLGPGDRGGVEVHPEQIPPGAVGRQRIRGRRRVEVSPRTPAYGVPSAAVTADALTYLKRPAAGEPAGALVLLHGRGTSEHDLVPLLDALDPERRLVGHHAARAARATSWRRALVRRRADRLPRPRHLPRDLRAADRLARRGARRRGRDDGPDRHRRVLAGRGDVLRARPGSGPALAGRDPRPQRLHADRGGLRARPREPLGAAGGDRPRRVRPDHRSRVGPGRARAPDGGGTRASPTASTRCRTRSTRASSKI